jgi:hypothetical protein
MMAGLSRADYFAALPGMVSTQQDTHFQSILGATVRPAGPW